MKDRKKKLPYSVYSLIDFILLFMLLFFFLFSVFHCIQNFTKINSMHMLLYPACISVIVSLILIIGFSKSIHKIQESKLECWLYKNSAKLTLCYIFFIIFILSISNKTTWTTSEINNVLSLEWMIFGLSLTIFLVWNVIIVEYLKKKQPKICDEKDLFAEYELLLDKQSFYIEAENTFSTVIILSVNLVLLILSSSFVYISNMPESVFCQNFVRSTFLFSTNAISMLFFDILKPLKKEKTDMLKNNYVSQKDVDNAQTAVVAQAIIDGIEKAVMSLDSEKYSEEEKRKLIIGYLETFRDAARSSEVSETEKQSK